MPLCLYQSKRSLYHRFYESQFNYYPLICMLCSTIALLRVNNIHEIASQILFNLYSSEKSIHQNCLEFLILEEYIISNNELNFHS